MADEAWELRSRLNRRLSGMGRSIGLATVGLGVVFWIVGAIAIAIWAEVTHRTGTGGVINSTRFNIGFVIFSGALGFVVAARVAWKGAREDVRDLLTRLNGRGSVNAGAAAAGSTIIGLATGAGAVVLAIAWVIWWVTAVMLIPILLALGFFTILL